jgi:5'-3' exonuclease, N-terminal resolvase-like domain
MNVYVIDGTYELFRHFFAVPSSKNESGQEIGAVRGVLTSVFSMIEAGATHLGVATDHVVESFRNDLYPGYKTAEGVAPELLSQFPILEEALESMGVMVWPMTYFEADDALAASAAKAAADERVTQVLICTPDKDLAQCVVGDRVVQLDRRRNIVRNEAGVEEKFGVKPESIPDYLAATPPTDIPVLRDGERRRRPSRCRSMAISKTFRKIGRAGTPRSAGRGFWRNHYLLLGTRRCSIARWPLCDSMFQCLIRSTISGGMGPATISSKAVSALEPKICIDAFRPRRSLALHRYHSVDLHIP